MRGGLGVAGSKSCGCNCDGVASAPYATLAWACGAALLGIATLGAAPASAEPAAPPAATTTRILIVRHGEKPAAGLGQLDCKGLTRSLALADVILDRFGTPAAIFAPQPGG